jgi:MFS family permease
VALALIMNEFPEPGERAKAMGVFGFVSSGGGSIGVLLGGWLTSSLSWHWIFLVNIPIGIAVYALCRALLPDDRGMKDAPRLDVAGGHQPVIGLDDGGLAGAELGGGSPDRG